MFKRKAIPFSKGRKKRNSKIILKIFKNSLFKTTGPISTKFVTKHPWIDRIQIFPNEGQHPSSRGYESKIIKIYGEFFYFRTTGPVSTKLGIKHLLVEEIQIFFLNKEPCPSTR